MNQEETVLPLSDFIDLDRSGPIPLYFQLSQRIEKAITDNRLSAGSRLENEVSLGERLGLSRPTVRRAIQELVDKGLLVRRRGIGTQVVHGQINRKVELTSLFDDLMNSGQTPTSKVLEVRRTTADKTIAGHLGVRIGSPVLLIRRLRFAENVPVSILENWLPESYTDLAEENFSTHGLYQLLKARGVTMKVAKQRIGARKANQNESDLLMVEKGSALLTMERTAFDSNGKAVEWGHHCYRPDLYSFEITLVEK